MSTNSADLSEIIVINSSFNEQPVKNIISLYKDTGICIKYFFNCKKNISKSRNIGAQNAKNKHLVFIDDDVMVNKHFLKELSNLWISHPEKKIIGGTILVRKNIKNSKNHQMKKAFWKKIIKDNNWCFAYQKRTLSRNLSFGDLLFSACFSYKLDQNETTIFNEDFGINFGNFVLGGEDFELCSRLILEKKEIFYSNEKDIQVFHLIDNSRFRTTYLIKRYFLNGIELSKLEKHLKKIFLLKSHSKEESKSFNSLKLYSPKNIFCKYELCRLAGYTLHSFYSFL